MYSLPRGIPYADDRPAPQAEGRLLAVCPDVAELLAVTALRKIILSSTCLYPDCDVAEACQSEIAWDFSVLGKVIRKSGRFMVFHPSGGDQRVAVSGLTLMTSNPRLTSPSDMSSAGVFRGRWRITAFMGFSDFR
jgi:hypothetical protein